MTDCPLSAGEYTYTQTAGSTVTVSLLAPFALPVGATIVQDVAPASPPDCIHATVVPFPGGFSAPAFCIPALAFTTKFDQTGCGIGLTIQRRVASMSLRLRTSSPSSFGLPPAACATGAE